MSGEDKPEYLRLDRLLVERGLAPTRSAARGLILAGKVTVDGRRVDKAGVRVRSDATVDVAPGQKFVSRGGIKLAAALEAMAIEVRGRVCLDVGASTGGFTDCLLQRGARCVYAVDVGRGQLHWKLRNDHRVRLMEGINARFLEPGMFPEAPELACIDVSFISLTLVLPPVTQVLAPRGTVVGLVKPQFEAGRDRVSRGGVVRDPSVREEVVGRIREFARGLGLVEQGMMQSPLKGPAGNVEFLLAWRKR
ncbi:MAG TPA: TlyA family RNA methyltransferase [Kiritimatiellae bacterium]|nr:TlyA family RNA methyltransferase [Kiritimatiellia bacterium]